MPGVAGEDVHVQYCKHMEYITEMVLFHEFTFHRCCHDPLLAVDTPRCLCLRVCVSTRLHVRVCVSTVCLRVCKFVCTVCLCVLSLLLSCSPTFATAAASPACAERGVFCFSPCLSLPASRSGK